MSGFEKYRQRGAYHWREISLHPRDGWPYTRSRIGWVVRKCEGCREVLEVGCGDAATLGALARRGCRVTGVDSDGTGLELARAAFRERGLEGEFYQELGHVQGRVFDAVVLAEVIEHVDEPDVLLRNVAELLSPHGRLVLTTPVRLFERPLDHHHVQEYWPGELSTLLKRHFEVVESEFLHPAWLIDLMCWGVSGYRPVAVLANCIRALCGVELLDRLSSPLGLYWTQAAVCRRPRDADEHAGC